MSNAKKFELSLQGVIAEECTTPRNDGTQGSALYTVVIGLSENASPEWAAHFIQAWDFPSNWGLGHRPGIAEVWGNKVYLNGTTIEEVEETHKSTLQLAVNEANKACQNYLEKSLREQEKGERQEKEHRENLSQVASRIKFN